MVGSLCRDVVDDGEAGGSSVDNGMEAEEWIPMLEEDNAHEVDLDMKADGTVDVAAAAAAACHGNQYMRDNLNCTSLERGALAVAREVFVGTA
jgi:hypothetical protein